MAIRYGVDLQSVVSANHLDDANQIVAGVDIFLPGGRPIAASNSAAASPVADGGENDQSFAATGPPVPLPYNIDALWARMAMEIDEAKLVQLDRLRIGRDHLDLRELAAQLGNAGRMVIRGLAGA